MRPAVSLPYGPTRPVPFGPADGHAAVSAWGHHPHRTIRMERAPASLADPDVSADAPSGTTELAVTVRAAVSRGRALALLGKPGRNAWLGEVVEAGVADGHADRHLVDLELRFGDQASRIAFRKAAYVDVGSVRDDRTDSLRLGISWRAARLTPLFPVFSGTLSWFAGDLLLRQSRPEEALEPLREGEAVLRAIDNPVELAELLCVKGQAALACGDAASARSARSSAPRAGC